MGPSTESKTILSVISSINDVTEMISGHLSMASNSVAGGKLANPMPADSLQHILVQLEEHLDDLHRINGQLAVIKGL